MYCALMGWIWLFYTPSPAERLEGLEFFPDHDGFRPTLADNLNVLPGHGTADNFKLSIDFCINFKHDSKPLYYVFLYPCGLALVLLYSATSGAVSDKATFTFFRPFPGQHSLMLCIKLPSLVLRLSATQEFGFGCFASFTNTLQSVYSSLTVPTTTRHTLLLVLRARVCIPE